MSNDFYKSIIAANEYDGPAVVSVYTTCQPEHGVGDNLAMQQSKLAVDTRTFLVLIYDPRKGDKIAQRLSLQGNPSEKQDFFIEPKTNEVYDFIRFARTLPHGINTLETLRRARLLEIARLAGKFGRIIPRGEAASQNTSTRTATRAKRCSKPNRNASTTGTPCRSRRGLFEAGLVSALLAA